MRSLGTLGGSTSRAFGLNASGQIVGESETESGEVHATLWTVDVAVSVPVDVIPRNVNPGSKGVTPVVILTTTDFDATTIDPQTVELGPDGAPPAHGDGHITDVDGDGLEDLLLHFRTADSGIRCGDTEVSLDGQTFGGDAVTGTDAIGTVGCG